MQDKEITLKDYWQIIWSHRKFIIITVSIVTILAVIISLLLPKWYKATSVIMPPEVEEGQFGRMSANLGAFGLGGMLDGNENQMRLLTILKSRKTLELLDQKFDFQKKYETEYNFHTYDKIKSNLRIEVGEEEQIKISFLDKDQNLVANIVNYIVKSLDSLNIELSNRKAQKNKKFIETRIEGVRDSLTLYENKITKFMDENNIVSINEQLKEEVTHAAEMKASIMYNEVEIQMLESELSSDNRQIIDLKRKVKFLRDKYQNFFDKSQEDKLFINLKNIPDFQKRYAQLKRKVVYFTKLLEYLGPQYEQAKIEEAKDVPTIQVIDKAKRPEWKSKPKRAKIVALAFIISLIFSCYFSFVFKKK